MLSGSQSRGTAVQAADLTLSELMEKLLAGFTNRFDSGDLTPQST